jgi:hypothetical protein
MSSQKIKSEEEYISKIQDLEWKLERATSVEVVLPKRIIKYYADFPNEYILEKIYKLTKITNERDGGCESIYDELMEFKNEARRRDLNYHKFLGEDLKN